MLRAEPGPLADRTLGGGELIVAVGGVHNSKRAEDPVLAEGHRVRLPRVGDLGVDRLDQPLEVGRSLSPCSGSSDVTAGSRASAVVSRSCRMELTSPTPFSTKVTAANATSVS